MSTPRHVLFLSRTCTFCLMGLSWLVLQEQGIATAGICAPSNWELRPCEVDLKAGKTNKNTKRWVQSRFDRQILKSPSGYDSPRHTHTVGAFPAIPLRGSAAGTEPLSDSSLSCAASLPLSLSQRAAKCCWFVFKALIFHFLPPFFYDSSGWE